MHAENDYVNFFLVMHVEGSTINRLLTSTQKGSLFYGNDVALVPSINLLTSPFPFYGKNQT